MEQAEAQQLLTPVIRSKMRRRRRMDRRQRTAGDRRPLAAAAADDEAAPVPLLQQRLPLAEVVAEQEDVDAVQSSQTQRRYPWQMPTRTRCSFKCVKGRQRHSR